MIRHALKHPSQRYTFASHQKSHNIAYQTARTDLMNLEEQGLLLSRKKDGKCSSSFLRILVIDS